MIDLSRMSASEVMAEGVRRADRRARGLPLEETPAEREERLQSEDMRLEKEIQRDVVKLYRAHGCIVYALSQTRASKQTPGIGDLYVLNPVKKRDWWHETKTLFGRQSPDQREFSLLCHSCTVEYVIGGVEAARRQLKAIGYAV